MLLDFFQLNLCFRTLCVLGGGICRPRDNRLARVHEREACLLLFQYSLSWACGMHCLLHKVMTLEFMYRGLHIL